MELENYVITHKSTFIPANDYLTPIQVGSCHHDHINGYLHDDEGDNISELNKDYCELTGMYWIWKNRNRGVDYVGISHYRRYLCLNPDYAHKFFTHWKRYYIINSLTSMIFSELGYHRVNVEKILDSVDIVIPECSNCTERGMKNFYELYINTKRQDLLDHILDYMIERYPEYKEASELVRNSTKGYHCNIFIMKADIYDNYCEWIFSILDHVYKEYRQGKIDSKESRFIGYYAEYLSGIFFVKCQLDGKKVVEYPAVFFRHCDGKDRSLNDKWEAAKKSIYRFCVPISSVREKFVYSLKDKVSRKFEG